jgi:hypothetical protein
MKKNSKLYYFNISFDLSIGGYDLKPYQKILDEMSLLALTLGTSHDSIICAVEPSQDYLDYLKELGLETCLVSNDKLKNINNYEPIVWGWDKSVSELFKENTCKFNVPHNDSVKKVNSKVFSNQLAEKLGLPHGGICYTKTEIYSAVSAVQKLPLVIKPAYGSAGVGFIKKRENELAKQEILKIEKYFSETGNALIVEEWRSREKDYSLSFNILAEGKLSDYTINLQTINTRGIFQAVTLDYSDTLLEKNRALIQKIYHESGAALYKAGYFGPVGIDMYSYYDEHNCLKLNPLCEINARRTMAYIPRQLKSKYPKIKKCMLVSLAKKELGKLRNYAEVSERLRNLHFDKKTGRGLILLLPLYYLQNKSLAKNSRNFLFIAADSNEELDLYYNKFKEAII